MNTCPTCKEVAAKQCKCFRMDSHCKNGHVWHYCAVHRKKVEAAYTDHTLKVTQCTCIEGKP